MGKEITLQDFIEKLKGDLLSAKGSPDYPLFIIDKVEVEIAVKITAGASGAVNIAIVELGLDDTREKTHTVKVTLQPILGVDEIREKLKKDVHLFHGIEKTSQGALVKSGENDIAGDPA